MDIGDVGSTAEELKIIRRTLVVKTALELWRFYHTNDVGCSLAQCIKEVVRYNNDPSDKDEFWDRNY